MAYLEFEAMGIKRVKTELSVANVDHNTLQTGFAVSYTHLDVYKRQPIILRSSRVSIILAALA